MPGSRIARVRRQPGLLAAAAVVAATGMVALVGVAGAAEEGNVDVFSKDAGTRCFSENAAGACQPGEIATVEIQTGDTVTWNFAGNAEFHNAAVAEDVDVPSPAWKYPPGAFVNGASDPNRYSSPVFAEEGVYEFLCQAHPEMRGTITVSGEPVETQTPTPSVDPTATATSTPDPTPTTQPGGGGGDDHTSTPAPTGGADAVKPRISRVRATAVRNGANVRFRLSEPATLTVKLKHKGKRGKVLKTVRVHAPAGTRTLRVRGQRLKRGRYVVQLRARDASGNRSSLATSSMRRR